MSFEIMIKGKGLRTVFAVLLILSLISISRLSALALVEIGEDYVLYDLREYDGNSSLPFGRGINSDCYYPRTQGDYALFPEVYTFGHSSLSEQSDGVRWTASRSGSVLSVTLDKVPAMIQQSVSREFKYCTLYVKPNYKGDATVTFMSLGTNYKKVYSVNLSGDWQRITLDLSEKNGWQSKRGDGTYYDITYSPWTEKHFGTDGFAINFSSFGNDIKNEIIIDYFAFAKEKDTVMSSGRTESRSAYLKGFTDGSVHPSEYLTRAQAIAMTARAVSGEDFDGKARDTRFSDIPKEHWCSGAVAFLYEKGALGRFTEENLRPYEAMSRSDFAALIHDAFLAENSLGISKGTQISGEQTPITRAEACVMLNTLFESTDLSELSVNDDLFCDMDSSHYAYKDVVLATSDYYRKKENITGKVTYTLTERPDYTLTNSLLADIDSRAEEMKRSIRLSENTVLQAEKCYYVSPNGNDSNSGTSPDSPWKTLKKVNAVGFTAGSVVLFERGGLWRGSLRILPSVTYSAYGEGEKPTFYGSLYDGADASLWSLVEGTNNIWRFKYDMLDLGGAVFNHGEFHSYKETPSYKDGVYLHRNSSRVFDFKTDISKNLGIFCDNKKELSSECPLYMRCDEGNPGELFKSIEFMPRQNILSVVANKDVVIDNFRIMYGGAHGIGAGTLDGFTVRNCEFFWIGGSVHTYSSGGGTMAVRYGNAIESYGSPKRYYVENNYIHQVYDAGITHQLGNNNDAGGVQSDIRYANNLIEFCSYSIEYFLGERADGTVDRYMQNVVIEDNVMRYAGFGFGNQRTDRLCMSHIKSSGTYMNKAESFTIKNNIFDRSREMLIYISAGREEYLPRLEGNVYIQYETLPETPNSTLGYYGVTPARLRFFSRDIKNVMVEKGIEENPEIYFAERDWLYELPGY